MKDWIGSQSGCFALRSAEKASAIIFRTKNKGRQTMAINFPLHLATLIPLPNKYKPKEPAML